MLLVYPFVRHISRFSLLRNSECSPRSSSPPRLCLHNADPAETTDTPHSGHCNTPPPPATDHTIARRYPRCGRLLPSPPNAGRPFPPLPPAPTPAAPRPPPVRCAFRSRSRFKICLPLFDPPQQRRRSVTQHPPKWRLDYYPQHTSQRPGLSPPAPSDDRPRRVRSSGGGIRHRGKPAGHWRTHLSASGWNRSLDNG